jgi:hypothetical protein
MFHFGSHSIRSLRFPSPWIEPFAKRLRVAIWTTVWWVHSSMYVAHSRLISSDKQDKFFSSCSVHYRDYLVNYNSVHSHLESLKKTNAFRFFLKVSLTTIFCLNNSPEYGDENRARRYWVLFNSRRTKNPAILDDSRGMFSILVAVVNLFDCINFKV